MQAACAAMRDGRKLVSWNRNQDCAGGCFRNEQVRSFHLCRLRLYEEIADTSDMVRSNRQIACVALLVSFYSPLFFSQQNSKKSDVKRYFSNESTFLRFSHFHGQSVPPSELRALLDRQARWDDTKLSDPSQSGLRLHFEKIDEQPTQVGREPVRYRVFAEGAPQDKVFVFQTWRVDNAISTDPRDIYVNAQGLLMTHLPKPEEETSLKVAEGELEVASPTENAEPIRFLLARRDGETSIFGTLVSHPVESYDQGCRLEVRAAQPGAMAVLIIVDGFPAKSKIPLVLESEGSVVSEVLDANSDGHAVMAVFPAVDGKTRGTLKASAEGSNCLPSVVLPWSAPADSAPKTPGH